MSEPAVLVRDLTKVYVPSPVWMRVFLRTQVRESVRALDAVSMEFAPGEICAVAGPNGAGKTTLFKILTGLLAPTSGSATVVGIDATRQSPELRRVVGFMAGDDRSLWLRLTCVQNLEFRGRLQGMPAPELRRRIDDVLEAVGLADVRDRAGFALSAGMRARLQLACAMLHHPPVLVLDEPTAAVDPVGSFELLQQIRQVTTERRLAVLFSTHRVDEIEALGEKVVLLHRGHVVHAGHIDLLRSELDRLQITFSFRSQAVAQRAAAAVANGEVTEIVMAEGHSFTVGTGELLGELISRLGPLSAEITAISEERVPLRQVLADVLSQHSADGEAPA